MERLISAQSHPEHRQRIEDRAAAVPRVSGSISMLKNRYQRDFQIEISEADILAALSEPRTLESLRRRISSNSKTAKPLHELLLTMRAEGKLAFDINTGKWARPDPTAPSNQS